VVCPGNEEVRRGSTVRLRAPGRGGRTRKKAAREGLVRVDWVGTNWVAAVSYPAFQQNGLRRCDPRKE
jgi:hypothetical protein